MDIHDAAKIAYAGHPKILRNIKMQSWMDEVQEWWKEEGNAMSWRDESFHAVWWSLYALLHNDPKALENAHAYLSLAKRGNDDTQTNTKPSGNLPPTGA